MLVLTRKVGESIVIDDHVKVTVVQVKGKQVRVGVDAPAETRIHREEIYNMIVAENKAAIAGAQAVIQSQELSSATQKRTGTEG